MLTVNLFKKLFNYEKPILTYLNKRPILTDPGNPIFVED